MKKIRTLQKKCTMLEKALPQAELKSPSTHIQFINMNDLDELIANGTIKPIPIDPEHSHKKVGFIVEKQNLNEGLMRLLDSIKLKEEPEIFHEVKAELVKMLEHAKDANHATLYNLLTWLKIRNNLLKQK